MIQTPVIGDNVSPIIAVAKEAVKNVGTIQTTADGRQFMLFAHNNGASEVRWLTDAKEQPQRIAADRLFHEGDSLVAYIRPFQTGASTMIADLSKGAMKVYLDYHEKAKPSTMQHSATWVLPFSSEFQVWNAHNGKPQEQGDFMQFLQENFSEVKSPDPAKIMELVSDFEVLKTVEFRSAKRLQNGLRQFVYKEAETGASQGVNLPEKITLEMPIFRGEQPLTFSAFVRYRITDGGLKLWYEFHRIEPVKEAAFRQAVTRIAEAAGMTPLYGNI